MVVFIQQILVLVILKSLGLIRRCSAVKHHPAFDFLAAGDAIIFVILQHLTGAENQSEAYYGYYKKRFLHLCYPPWFLGTLPQKRYGHQALVWLQYLNLAAKWKNFAPACILGASWRRMIYNGVFYNYGEEWQSGQRK
jgi:hypothetical protein